MAFSPLTASQPIGYALGRSQYRNVPRENAWGSPVFYVPTTWAIGTYGGFGGPKYREGYTYYNSPETVKGNCTWWCWARLYEATGTQLNTYGDASNWYDRYAADGGSVSTNANNINAGDIIVLTDGGAGHVMFVERVVGSTITISQSAYSYRSVWTNMACLVTTFDKSQIYRNASVNIYKDLDSPAYQTVVGVMHTGGSSPTPPQPGGDTPDVTFTPTSYTRTMSSTQSYLDFNYTVTVSGIPINETANDGISFSTNCYRLMYTTGWSYSDYIVDGVQYHTGTRQLIVRYERRYSTAYTDDAYMFYRKTFSNGNVNDNTRMHITVEELDDDVPVEVLNYLLKRKRKRFNVDII